MTTPSFRDVEQISALLDGQLPRQDIARLQSRIAADPELGVMYRQLSQSRALLRKLPARRAPRNFTLTHQMAGVRAPAPRSLPLFRLASVFAGLLLVLTFAANGLGQMAVNTPEALLASGVGGAPMAESMELPAAAAFSDEQALELDSASDEAPAVVPPALSATAPDDQRAGIAPPAEPPQPLTEEYGEADEIPMAKSDGNENFSRQRPPTPARAPFQIPGWLQSALLIIAVLTGGAAWYVNRRADARFARKNKQ